MVSCLLTLRNIACFVIASRALNLVEQRGVIEMALLLSAPALVNIVRQGKEILSPLFEETKKDQSVVLSMDSTHFTFLGEKMPS